MTCDLRSCLSISIEVAACSRVTVVDEAVDGEPVGIEVVQLRPQRELRRRLPFDEGRSRSCAAAGSALPSAGSNPLPSRANQPRPKVSFCAGRSCRKLTLMTSAAAAPRCDASRRSAGSVTSLFCQVPVALISPPSRPIGLSGRSGSARPRRSCRRRYCRGRRQAAVRLAIIVASSGTPSPLASTWTTNGKTSITSSMSSWRSVSTAAPFSQKRFSNAAS